jgi:eukaryotic-like serine/threonine-protein kinase
MASAHEVTAPVKEGEILAAKYRIEKVIGVGGMGIVVSAMHLELDQRVALKFLLPQAAQSEELVGRFVREAKSSAKLKGRHVAKVLDVGRMDDGRAYIVMEYLEGRDLGAELKASGDQFPIEDAVSWMLQACEGLAEAHALGIIHRDLKPGNLFLTRGPEGRPLVKVLDFGISKSINPNASDMFSLTKTEMLLGSPLYMAPEQMRSSKHVDERSDIWALGAIAYELLCRRVPFEADTLLDLCFKVAQEGCPDVIELRPEIPEELGRIVMRCLEKEREARWNDIGELAAALEPFGGPNDKGSADRTIAVLANGIENSRARRSEPVRSAAKAIGSPRDTSDSKRISKSSASKRQSSHGVKRSPDGKPVVVSDDPLVSATDETARFEVPSTPPSTESGASADDSMPPDAVPASSAWGTTNARVLEEKKKNSRRGLIAGAAVAAAVAVAFLVSRGGGSTTTPPAAKNATPTESPSPVHVPVPVPVPEPVPVPVLVPDPTTTTATTTTTASTAAIATSVGTVATASLRPTGGHTNAIPVTHPKASASSSAAPPPVAAPKPSSDFIRERE